MAHGPSVLSLKSKPPTPLIESKDVVLLGILPAMALIAWLMPEMAWPAFAGGVARLRSACLPRQTRTEVAAVHAVTGTHPLGMSSARCWHRHRANQCLASLQLLRCHLPGGWSPEVQLDGREHLDAALAAGQGGVLWVAPFVFSDLVTKIACHRAGYRISHLSRDTHGFSATRVGQRLLNPIKTRIEQRYLAERLVLSADNSVRPLRELARRLAENRLVSITVAATGQRSRTLPFLDGAIRLATGAPTLALQTGAPLLPVFTLRYSDGGYLTRVEPPLAVPTGLPREAAIDAILTRYLPLLESCVWQHPDQFSLPYLTTSETEPLPVRHKVKGPAV